MSTEILEVRYRGRYDQPAPGLIQHTAGAEDPETTTDQIRDIIGRVFNEGHQRRQKIERMASKEGALTHYRDGTYYIRYTNNSRDATFSNQANYNYLKDEYGWLHEVSGGLGFDEDEAIDSHGEFDTYLADIDEDQWKAFLEDMRRLANGADLDDDGTWHLESEEQTRWMKEDGAPELIKEMVETAKDSYEAYLLSNVTLDMVWEWCRETDRYPETEDGNSVWMDMDKYGKDPEVQEWFIDQLDDDHEGWLAIKRKDFEEGASVKFQEELKIMASEDEEVAHVYNRLDNEGLWQLFLKVFPDEPDEGDERYWELTVKPYEKEESWRLDDYAIQQMSASERVYKLVRGWFNRPPEGHPEFKFESKWVPKRYKLDDEFGCLTNAENLAKANPKLRYVTGWTKFPEEKKWGAHAWCVAPEGTIVDPYFEQQFPNDQQRIIYREDTTAFESVSEALEPDPFASDPDDPDDPVRWMKHGGGLQEDVIYEDDKIVVTSPRDAESFNWHLRRAGRVDVDERIWNSRVKDSDVFVIQSKLPPDLMGHVEKRELAVIWGDAETGLAAWIDRRDAPTFDDILRNPDYGRSIRRALLRHYREHLENDPKVAGLLLQIGGGREVRRAERRGHMQLSELGVSLGIYYVNKHKYRHAAKALNRSVSTITPKGVWLIYDDVSDLIPVFKNEAGARTVFDNEHHDWFDYYENPPAPEDVIPFLDAEAIKHIRSAMTNRRVYFPDTDEWVVTTQKFLADYDDKTLLDWIVNPTDEDEQEGTWDDIREAMQYAAADILQATTYDEISIGFQKAAVDAIGGTEHKWGTHPSKRGKKGEATDAFMVFVPWRAINDFANDWQQEHGYPYDGDLESLAIDKNADSIEPDPNNMEASWRDVNKEYAKEHLQRIYDLEVPKPVLGSPEYVDPAQGELPIGEAEEEDDPELMLRHFTHVPVQLESRVKAILRDSSEAHHYQFFDLNFDLRPYEPHSEEEIDASDGRLWNMAPHDYLIISYRTEPGDIHYEVESEVFRKVKETVINVMREFEVQGSYIMNTQDYPEGTEIFHFALFPIKKPKPEPVEAGEVPF